MDEMIWPIRISLKKKPYVGVGVHVGEGYGWNERDAG